MPDVSMHFLSGPRHLLHHLLTWKMECVCESMCIWVGGVFYVSLGLSVRVCVYASMCACDVLLGLFLAGPTCRSECVCVCVCVCVCLGG